MTDTEILDWLEEYLESWIDHGQLLGGGDGTRRYHMRFYDDEGVIDGVDGANLRECVERASGNHLSEQRGAHGSGGG